MLSLNQFKRNIFVNEAYVTAVSVINTDIIRDVFIERDSENGKGRHDSCRAVINDTVYEGNIIKFEKSLDNIIYDTKPSEEIIRMPYKKFFIDKYFIVDEYIVCGAAITNLSEGGSAVILPIFDISKENYGDFDCEMMVSISDNSLNYSKLTLDDKTLDSKEKRKYESFINEILIYITNAINLYTMHSEDIVYVTSKTSGKPKPTMFGGSIQMPVHEVTRFDVKGQFKVYLNNYNKIKKSKKARKLTQVKGHWRYLRSPKFKYQRRIWISPYYKGDGKDIVKKFIIVTNDE